MNRCTQVDCGSLFQGVYHDTFLAQRCLRQACEKMLRTIRRSCSQRARALKTWPCSEEDEKRKQEPDCRERLEATARGVEP